MIIVLLTKGNVMRNELSEKLLLVGLVACFTAAVAYGVNQVLQSYVNTFLT